jgi:uncharacterized protein YoxC
MVEFAAATVAVAFAVLVGYLIPTILQVKRTVAQSERLLARLNQEIPILMKELRGTSENVRIMTDQAKVGVDQASVFLKAVGDVGHSVKQVHGVVRGKSGVLVMGLASLYAGVKAASSKVKHRVSKKRGGENHGK